MIEIKTYPILDQNLKDHLERIGDLINTDEPLLSLFKDNRNENLYLFDWVDADSNANRWLVYKIDYRALSDFINQKISFRKMLNTVENYYVTDINNGQNPPFDISQINELPDEYNPDSDLNFDESDAKNLPKIKSILEHIIKTNLKKNALPYTYVNAYKNKLNTGLERQRVNYWDNSIHVVVNKITDEIHILKVPRQHDNKPNKVLRQKGVALF